MEIVKSLNALLSNHEVYTVLQNLSKKTKKMGKKALPSQANFSNIIYDTEKYLEDTPCKYQNPEAITNFLKALLQKGFKLTKAEKLQLVNLRPVTPVEIQLIVEDSEERISEEQIYELLALVKEYLPDRLDNSCPNGT